MTVRPRCPQPQNFSIVTGFLTPGSDTGPGALDGSISLDVFDPTENNERVRAVEVSDPWGLEVDWCICGRFADLAVIDGDPLTDITAMRRVSAVFKGGVSHDPQVILKEVPVNPNCRAA